MSIYLLNENNIKPKIYIYTYIMKFITLIVLFFITIASFAQNALVKFKNGTVAQGLIETSAHFDDARLTNSKKKEHILFKKEGAADFETIETRSIASFVVLDEYNQSIEYFVVPVRKLKGKNAEVEDREELMLLKKLYDDGKSIEVYGTFASVYLVSSNGTKDELTPLFFSYLKTKEMEYAVVTKSHDWAGVWPSFKSISAFLSKCPDAKAIFDERYPNTLRAKRRFEKDLLESTKDFIKEYKATHKNYKPDELRLANREHQYQIHSNFYKEVIDLYHEHCVSKAD